MKSVLGLFITFFPVIVFGGQPLLLHAYDEGLVPPYMYHRGDCAIYTDRIVINRNYNGVETQEVRKLVLSPDALAKLQSLITKASTGKVQEKEMPTDIPYDGYTAYVHPQAPSIILKVSQSMSAKENVSEEAHSLLLLIDAHCPNLK